MEKRKFRIIGLGEPGPQALIRKGSEEKTGVKILSLAKEPSVERVITPLLCSTTVPSIAITYAHKSKYGTVVNSCNPLAKPAR